MMHSQKKVLNLSLFTVHRECHEVHQTYEQTHKPQPKFADFYFYFS